MNHEELMELAKEYKRETGKEWDDATLTEFLLWSYDRARPAKQVDLWTDGSSEGKRGIGGWAYIIKEGESQIVPYDSGAVEDTTNNGMEMTAILMGLEQVPAGAAVTVHTDSKLCIGWLSQNWKCNHRHIRVIRERIWAVSEAKGLASLTYEHVKGHNGNRWNEHVDKLAREARENFAQKHREDR